MIKKRIPLALAFIGLLASPLAAASITVTSPGAGASWCRGSSHPINWVKSGEMQATVAIRLRAAGSSESDPAVLAIANGTANSGLYVWTIPNTVAPGNYFIRVRTDDSTVVGDSGVFTIPDCGASISVVNPAAGAIWFQEKPYAITWTSTNVTQTGMAIRLRRSGSPESEPAALAIADGVANNFYYAWTVPATLAPGSYFVRVRTDDSAVIGDSAAFTIKGSGAQMIQLPEQRPLPPDLLKFPSLAVSDIDLVPNAEGFAIVFSYKNVGKGPLPKAVGATVKPNYRVLIDGRETASGSLFIPAFPAPPGWEQVGFFGGTIVMPTNLYDDKLWHIGNLITVHINENKVMGMESNTLGLNLKPIALKYAYDVRFTNVAFDWAANELRMSVRIEGRVPPGKKLRFSCPGEFHHDVDLHPGQQDYSYAHKLIYKPPKGQNWTQIHASAYMVPLPGGGERLLDIDLRNNQGDFRFERPPRPAEVQH
jgi:hypothetical protein